MESLICLLCLMSRLFSSQVHFIWRCFAGCERKVELPGQHDRPDEDTNLHCVEVSSGAGQLHWNGETKWRSQKSAIFCRSFLYFLHDRSSGRRPTDKNLSAHEVPIGQVGQVGQPGLVGPFTTLNGRPREQCGRERACKICQPFGYHYLCVIASWPL